MYLYIFINSYNLKFKMHHKNNNNMNQMLMKENKNYIMLKMKNF